MLTVQTFRRVMEPRRRRWFAAGAALALAAGLAGGHWLPDWGLRWGLAKALRDLGWTRVGVGDAEVALFDGAVVIHRVIAGDSLGTALGIGGLDLTFRWKPLFSRRVSLERLDLDGVEVEVRRDGDGFVVNGLPVAMAAGGGSAGPWSFDVTSLRLTESRILLVDGGFTATVAVDSLELNDLRSWDAASPATFRLSGRLNGSPIAVTGSATPFAAPAGFSLRIELDGLDLAAFVEPARRAGLSPLAGRLSGAMTIAGADDRPLTAEGRMTMTGGSAGYGTTAITTDSLDWQGSLTLAGGRIDAAGTLRARGLSVIDGSVAVAAESAELTATALTHDGTTLRADGHLEAAGTRVGREDVAVGHRRLAWTGHLTVESDGRYRAEGRAEADDTEIHAADLLVTARKAAVEGRMADAPAAGVLPPLAGSLSLTAEGVHVAEPGRDWLATQRLEARGLRLDPGGPVRLERLEARGVAALARHGKGGYPWRAEAHSLALTDATVAADGGLAADALSAGGALLRVTRGRDGVVGLDSQGDGANRRLALGRLRLSAGSRLEFEDRSTAEPVRLTAEALDLTVGGFDSDHPDQDSPFSLKARVGAARIAANGRVRPFAPRFGGEASGEIRALELPPLSPYAADALGVHLHTGQLDADFDLSARAGKLDGALQLALNKLFIAQPDPAAPLARQADMPLETVLDLLRDGDDRIRLSVPVRGDLDAPDFDVSDAVNQAIGGALKSTVVTTLKVAFPVAALIGFVIDEAANPRLSLEPLAFPPGADALAEAERARLAKVADLLGQRPGLRLTLCGVASQPADWPALAQARERPAGVVARLRALMGTAPSPEVGPVDRDRLAELAEARAGAAKAFLVEEGGIDPGRLFTCRPKIETEPKSGPRVDLLL